MTAGPTWPSGTPWPPEPSGHRHQDDHYAQGQSSPDHTPADQEPAHAVIGEMARLLKATHIEMLMDGCVLAGIMIGIAVESMSWTRALHPSLAGVVDLGLMCGAAVTWLIAASVLVWAGRPVLHALSEHRWKTGAPLDPRARWLTLPPVGSSGEEWTWTRAHLLLGGARLAMYRIHLAGTWTIAAAVFFLVCTGALVLGL
jgi:hypothetical protein